MRYLEEKYKHMDLSTNIPKGQHDVALFTSVELDAKVFKLFYGVFH